MAWLGNKGILDADFAHGDTYFAEARRLAEDAHDLATLATILVEQVVAERYKGDYRRAIELYRASLAAAAEIERTDLAVDAQCCLGVMALRQGDLQKALALTEPTLPVWQAIHDRFGMACAQLVMVRATTLLGDYARARRLAGEAETTLRKAGYDSADHITVLGRANLEYASGRVDSARQLYERV